MRNLDEVYLFMKRIFGEEISKVVKMHTKDAFYYSKALALTDTHSSAEEIQEKFANISRGVMAEAVGMYLNANHTGNGSVEINVGPNDIYDKDMNLIQPIKELSNNQNIITDIMVASFMDVFARGRLLAGKIIDRCNKSVRPQTPEPSPKDVAWEPTKKRDYAANPPMERVEIEIMRLESRLPNLSAEEGEKLNILYCAYNARFQGTNF